MEFKSAWVTPTHKIYEAYGETDMALCNGPGYTKQWRFTKEREKRERGVRQGYPDTAVLLWNNSREISDLKSMFWSLILMFRRESHGETVMGGVWQRRKDLLGA